MAVPERAQIVADALRFFGTQLWLGCVEDQEWAVETAIGIEEYDFDEGGWSCPICQEVACDAGCPLESLRVDA